MQTGDICKYLPTSTVGKVMDIREADGKVWALLDFTNLYYVIDHLAPADVSEYKEVSYKEREMGHSHGLKSVKEFEKTAEDVNIDTFTPSGGG